MQRSDEELFRLMKSGDRQAFAELYERREPALFRYGFHMSGNAAVAEEIAQEMFVQLMSANTRFDERRGSLEAWMYGVARNLVRVHRRKGPVEEPVDQPFDAGILGALITMRICRLADGAGRIADRYRDTVVLCDLEERDYDEAARLNGVSRRYRAIAPAPGTRAARCEAETPEPRSW